MLHSLFIYALFCHLVDVSGRFKEPGGDVLWRHTYCAIFQIMQLSCGRAHPALHHKTDSIMFCFPTAASQHSGIKLKTQSLQWSTVDNSDCDNCVSPCADSKKNNVLFIENPLF